MILGIVQTIGGFLGIVSASILLWDRVIRQRPYANFFLQKHDTVGGGHDLRLRVQNTAKITLLLSVPANVQGTLYLSLTGSTHEAVVSALRRLREERFTFLLQPDEFVDLRATFARTKEKSTLPDVLRFRITWSPAQRSHLSGWAHWLPTVAIPLHIVVRNAELRELRQAAMSQEELLYPDD